MWTSKRFVLFHYKAMFAAGTEVDNILSGSGVNLAIYKSDHEFKRSA